ncbi:MAG: hypothetical protein LUB61_01315, partial [Eggerthellaceae bacterium]|nr:hypothetical protein [Eggerthellaceae bacterium]
SEAGTIIASIASNELWVAIVFACFLSVVVAGFGVVITYNVLGKKSDGIAKVSNVSPVILVPEFVMLACIVWFGVYTPQIIVTDVEESVIEVTQDESYESLLHEQPLFDYIATEAQIEETAEDE